jgi:hypothetical protein
MIDIMQLPGISDPEAPSRLQAYSPQQLDLSGAVLQKSVVFGPIASGPTHYQPR